jgi:hypothetical protein
MSEQAITDIIQDLEDELAKPVSEYATQICVSRKSLARVLCDWQSMRSAIYGRLEQSSKEGKK